MATKRWERARSVEKEHEKHRDFMTRSQAEDRLGKYALTTEDIEGKRILGVGAGTGMVHVLPGAELAVALDPLTSTFDVDMSQSTARPITGAGEYLPLPDESFEFVVSYNVLDHTSNPTAVLKEINRVLTPGGILLFNVSVFSLPKKIRKRLTHIDDPHPHHFSTEEIRNRLSDADFEIKMESRWIPDFENPSFKLKVAISIFRMEKLDIKAQKR